MQAQSFGFSVEISSESIEHPSITAVFDEAFLEAVDSAFSMLGDTGERAVYRYLESRCSIHRADIAREVAPFAEALEALFGQSAGLIEIRMMRVLHQKFPSFDFRTGNGDLSFVEYVEALRRFL